MHELLAPLSSLMGDGSTQIPAPADSSNLKIAIITAISVVIAAALTAAATTFQRRREVSGSDNPSTRNLIAELQRRAEAAEARANAEEARNDLLSRRVDELEGHCWQNGVDPRTGEPIKRPRHAPDGGT